MLGDLWSYRLADFIPFDRAIYEGLDGQIDATFGVLPPLFALVGLGLVCLAVLAPLHPATGRVVSLALGLAFATVATVFFFGAYGNLTWAAAYPAWTFVAQAALFAVAGGLVNLFQPLDMAATRLTLGIVGVVIGTAVVPLVQWAFFGQPFADLGWFGFAPTPTAVVALGFLAIAESRWRFLGAIVPVAWLIVDTLTYLGLDAPVPALLPALTAVFGLIGVVMPAHAAGRLRERIDRSNDFAPLSPSNVVNAGAELAGRMRRTPATSLMPTLTPRQATDKRDQMAALRGDRPHRGS